MDNDLYILGVKVSRVNFSEAVKKIRSFALGYGKHLIVTPYSESIVAAVSDIEFRKIINDSALSVPDGGGILAAAEFLSYKLPSGGVLRLSASLAYALLAGIKLLMFRGKFRLLKETVSGVDLLESLCYHASRRGLRVYFLGGKGGVSEKAADIVRSMYPELKIAADEGPSDIRNSTAEEEELVIKRINEYMPDFLFVAFKPVEQEKWIYKNVSKIDAKVFMAVGGAFDMISGEKKRAPKFLRTVGLEWFWRLIIEPSRIRRIYNAVVIFPYLVIMAGLRHKKGSSL